MRHEIPPHILHSDVSFVDLLSWVSKGHLKFLWSPECDLYHCQLISSCANKCLEQFSQLLQRNMQRDSRQEVPSQHPGDLAKTTPRASFLCHILPLGILLFPEQPAILSRSFCMWILRQLAMPFQHSLTTACLSLPFILSQSGFQRSKLCVRMLQLPGYGNAGNKSEGI